MCCNSCNRRTYVPPAKEERKSVDVFPSSLPLAQTAQQSKRKQTFSFLSLLPPTLSLCHVVASSAVEKREESSSRLTNGRNQTLAQNARSALLPPRCCKVAVVKRVGQQHVRQVVAAAEVVHLQPLDQITRSRLTNGRARGKRAVERRKGHGPLFAQMCLQFQGVQRIQH